MTEQQAKKILSQNLSRLLKDRSWCNNDLCRAMFDNVENANRTKVSRWVSGKCLPPIYSLMQIAGAFGVTPNALLIPKKG